MDSTDINSACCFRKLTRNDFSQIFLGGEYALETLCDGNLLPPTDFVFCWGCSEQQLSKNFENSSIWFIFSGIGLGDVTESKKESKSMAIPCVQIIETKGATEYIIQYDKWILKGSQFQESDKMSDDCPRTSPPNQNTNVQG